MRLLVCGGRLVWNDDLVLPVLDYLHREQPLSAVLGDDRLSSVQYAREWAEKNRVPFEKPSEAAALPDLILAYQRGKHERAQALAYARSGFRVLDAKTGQPVTP